MQNRRDGRKARRSLPPNERNQKSNVPSKLLEITGSKGKPKVTIDAASIKTLKKILHYENEHQALRE